MTDTDTQARVWIWFADNGNIRKWQATPFDEGQEYVLAAGADAMLDEMTRSCLTERDARLSAAQEGREAVAWETFRDAAYYDLWAVRRVGSTIFNEAFHVQSREEAEALAAVLNAPAQPAAQVVERAQGMVRSMDQWRNMVPKAVAEGSQAQVEYALHDAKHDIEAMWCALTSALASPTDADAAVGWRGMDSAPKDGTRFLALQGTHHFDCWWHVNDTGDEQYWMDEADSEPDPTHWMPLPAAPLTAAKAGENAEEGGTV